MHKLAVLLGDEAVQDAAQNAAQDVAVQGVTTAAASQPVADDGIQLSRQWHPAAMAAKTVIALGQQSVVNGKRIHSNTHIHSHPKHSHRYAHYKGSSDSKPRQPRQPSEQRPKNKNRNLI